MYYGSLKVNDPLTITVNTHNPTNGMAVSADSAPIFHVYKDNSATPILTGTMALLNSPNAIGFYSAQFMATGTIFSKASSYNVYVRAVVNGVTGTVGHNFQIEAEVDSNTVSAEVGISTGTFLDALADKVWDELLSGHLTPGSAGYTLFSRMPTGTVLVGDKTGFYLASPQTFDLIGNVSGTITNVFNVINPVTAGNVTGSVLGNVNGSVNSVVQPVGVSTGTFLDAMADKVWDEALSGHLTPDSAGHTLWSRMPSGTVVLGDKTGFSLLSPQVFDLIGNITGTITNVLNVINPVGIVTGSFINAIADQVWDEQISGHIITGSTGEKLNSAGGAGDPWSTALPGAYGAGTAGNILGTNLDAPVSGIPTANQNADALLKRDWTAVTGEAARSVLNALRFIRNKFSTTATPGSVTVYKEDDTTVAYTKTVTTDPSADPIVEG